MSTRAIGVSVLLVVVLSATSAHGNGAATGTVNVVNINKSWNGFMVQLNIPLTQGYEAACPLGNWAFLPFSDPFYNSMLASLLSAKLSGVSVTIWTIGCVSTPVQTAPLIGIIDFGTRNGG